MKRKVEVALLALSVFCLVCGSVGQAKSGDFAVAQHMRQIRLAVSDLCSFFLDDAVDYANPSWRLRVQNAAWEVIDLTHNHDPADMQPGAYYEVLQSYRMFACIILEVARYGTAPDLMFPKANEYLVKADRACMRIIIDMGW